MSEIKWMDLNEFMSLGFLQEANRLFFHPLGLALAFTCDDETGEVINIAGIWDCRDDPEGVIFDEVDMGKALRVAQQREIHYTTRALMFKDAGAPALRPDIQPINWKPDDGEARDE